MSMPNNTPGMPATTMSNRLFSCLNEAIEEGGVSLDKMLQWNQTSVGNVIRRGYLSWDGKTEMFVVTPLGMMVSQQFAHTDIGRLSMFRPLSSLIKDRHVHKLVEHAREELKQDFQKLKLKDKEDEATRVKRQRATMKAANTPGNGNGHAKSGKARTAA